MFVGLPPDRPGRAQDLSAVADRVRAELAAFGLRTAQATVMEAGHAAGAMAVHAAWQAIRTGAAEFALAGGADSYTEPETLEWLEANDQVHSAGFQNNGYGFVPGEAAAFIMLGSASAAERCGLDPGLELVAAQTARETNLIKTDTVCTGEGLTALFRSLAAALQRSIKVDHLYCDLNGEPYRADEFGFAIVRAGSLFKDPSAFTAPADCWGDVGAASGPLYLVLADAAARKSYAPRTHGRSVRELRVRGAMRIRVPLAGRGVAIMSLTVKVNGPLFGLVHKGSNHLANSTPPDVCKTPSPAGPVPIPYPIIISKSGDMANGTTTVTADGGNMIAVKDCEYSTCNGDEPGTAGGVVSNTNMKEAKFILYSTDVKMDGKNACRFSDKMTMNHQNTMCLAGTIPTVVQVSRSLRMSSSKSPKTVIPKRTGRPDCDSPPSGRNARNSAQRNISAAKKS